jgi:hypothetical protein
MKAKSPTMNGLTGTSQITFAIDTSTDKHVNLNKSGANGDDLIDLREVFFNVEGGFGTLSVGRTLALFQRQAILKDITLFGVGGMGGPDANGTGLGRIGAGYVYPDFRARFLWQSPDLNGLQASVGVFQPREHHRNANYTLETDLPMFQGEMTYSMDMGGAAANFWAGFLWQEADVKFNSANVQSTDDKLRSYGWNVGGQVSAAGLGLTASYYRGKGLGTLFVQTDVGCVLSDATTASCDEADNHGGYFQGTYTLDHGSGSKTMLGVSWGYSATDLDWHGTQTDAKAVNDGYTGGVYHDVNSWLKVIAEYNTYEYEHTLNSKVEGFSIGAFMFW